MVLYATYFYLRKILSPQKMSQWLFKITRSNWAGVLGSCDKNLCLLPTLSSIRTTDFYIRKLTFGLTVEWILQMIIVLAGLSINMSPRLTLKWGLDLVFILLTEREEHNLL